MTTQTTITLVDVQVLHDARIQLGKALRLLKCQKVRSGIEVTVTGPAGDELQTSLKGEIHREALKSALASHRNNSHFIEEYGIEIPVHLRIPAELEQRIETILAKEAK